MVIVVLGADSGYDVVEGVELGVHVLHLSFYDLHCRVVDGGRCVAERCCVLVCGGKVGLDLRLDIVPGPCNSSDDFS